VVHKKEEGDVSNRELAATHGRRQKGMGTPANIPATPSSCSQLPCKVLPVLPCKVLPVLPCKVLLLH
jgi:hypothetical protein